ncbi:transglycosylase domain-containing protein [Streptomyces sp. ID05-39B]|uniref:transglycosylase domain-containing protein n=1 Tax=Streptomyces sp. ID05-39B TaxID=3028664 RepID=UPI0029AAC84D|nr:transglycosylase domain-containing protein [Streptomyces sp. ID05-39B]MDX3526819.1 transglycosylase domain-containing protein [Streptomyces sp. ID05-39B]
MNVTGNGTRDGNGNGPDRLPRPARTARRPRKGRLSERRHRERAPLRIRLRRNWGRRLRRLFYAFLTLLATLCAAAVVAYHLTSIPKPHPETVTQSTVFLDSDGAYLGRRGPVDRQDIPLSAVPRHVQDAVIAAENRSFRTDTGISPRAIARATLATLTGGDPQGGSTITQQYVKNALLSPEHSLSRKAREALIAIKLDRTRTKDEILEGYLDTVYFGRGAAGIQSAARNYFGVDAKDLTVAQGAALASILNIPSYYEKAGSDPKVTAKLENRWEWVLDAMAASGSITAKQRAAARFPAFRFYPPGETEGQRQYLIDVAAKEAADRLGITEDRLASGGYSVTTTFDLALQDTAAQLVQKHPGGADVRVHTAIVGMVPGDGAVRLLYGGSDYARQSFNDAVNGAVEAGTALEPFGEVGHADEPLGKLLKTAAPTPLNLASAYAAVAADGRYATAYTVARITREGRTVYRARTDVRQVLDEKVALRAGVRSGAGPTPVAVAVAAGSAEAKGFAVAGAGGGITRRTVWATGYDSRLTLTVALFADRAGSRKGTTVPAQLPNEPSPTDFAQRVAAGTWEAATKGGSKSAAERDAADRREE